jgi:hypothetical protein
MTAHLKAVPDAAAASSPAAAALLDNAEALRAVEVEASELRSRQQAAQQVLTQAQRPGQELSDLEARLAAAISARLAGDVNDADETELSRQVAKARAAAADAAPTVSGASQAIGRVGELLGDVSRRRAQVQERRQQLECDVLEERMVAHAAGAEAAVAPFLRWFVEAFALAAVHDRLRGPGSNPAIPRDFVPRVTLPAPEHAAFKALREPRDLGKDIEARGQEVLRELGVEDRR